MAKQEADGHADENPKAVFGFLNHEQDKGKDRKPINTSLYLDINQILNAKCGGLIKSIKETPHFAQIQECWGLS